MSQAPLWVKKSVKLILAADLYDLIDDLFMGQQVNNGDLESVNCGKIH